MHTFHPFTREHFVSLAIGFTLTAALILFAKRSEKNQRCGTALLVFLNLSAYPLALWCWDDHPRALDNILPLHLCDLAAFVAGFALFFRKPFLLSLTYFWGLAATLQALITPAITIGPPSLPFIHFFIQHFAIVAAALYIPIVLGWRSENPWWKSPIQVMVVSLIYQSFALLINTLLKTNFAFASRPPDNPSLIDHLGPWPFYLFAMQAIAFLLYLLLALPVTAGKKQTTAPNLPAD